MQNKLDTDQSISTDGTFYRILVSVEVDSESGCATWSLTAAAAQLLFCSTEPFKSLTAADSEYRSECEYDTRCGW